MEAVARFLVSTVDLIEAEVAYLQRGVVRLGFALCAVVCGMILALIGTCLVLWAGYLLLDRLFGPIIATAVSGLLFLSFAAVLLRVAWQRATKLELIKTNSRSKTNQATNESNANHPGSDSASHSNGASREPHNHTANKSARVPG